MEGNNNFYVMLEKEWFYSEKENTLLQEYGDTCLMVYILMLRNLTSRNTFNFSINSLCSTLHKTKKRDNSFLVNKIKESIRRLNNIIFTVYLDSNCNLAADLTKIDNNITYFALRCHEPLKEKFIMIYDIEIDKLINYSCNKKNSVSEIITHFAFICNGFKGVPKDKKDMEGIRCYYGGMDYIEKKTGITQSTLLSNNKIFIELDILLISNAGGSIKERKYTNSSNVYARKEYKIDFDIFMNIRKEKLGKKELNKELQDKQRGLKQLINKYKISNSIYGLTKDELTPKQFMQLNILETNYVRCVIARGTTITFTLVTVKRNGDIKPQYIELLEEEDEDDVEDGEETSLEVVDGVEINEEEIDDGWGTKEIIVPHVKIEPFDLVSLVDARTIESLEILDAAPKDKTDLNINLEDYSNGWGTKEAVI